LLAVPEELYATEPGDGLRITVRRVPASTAAGAFTPSAITLLTRSQFERFLERQNVPVTDAESYFATLRPDDPLVATINLPEQTRRRAVSPISNVDMFGRPIETGFFQPSLWTNQPMPSLTRYGGLSLYGGPSPYGGLSPFGTGLAPSLYGDATMGGGPLNPFPPSVAYTPSAQELLHDVRGAPGSVTQKVKSESTCRSQAQRKWD